MNFIEFLKEKTGLTPPLPDRFGDWLGYSIEKVSKEDVLTKLVVKPEHLSPSGAVHGGVVSGFLDFTCGLAVFAIIGKDQLCSTVNLNVSYFHPIREGNVLLAKANVLHSGRSLCSSEAKLFLEGKEKQNLATATGTFNVYQLKV